jgi:hypothetical protein
VKEKELMAYKSNIEQMKKQKKVSEADYKKQVDGLNSVVADLTAQIKKLQEENQILITKNDSLGVSLAGQMTTNAELQTENKSLSEKVSLASLLKPTAITATGVRGKSSGKEVETDNSKKAEKLKVCFDLPENMVAEAGEKTFMVRIISPQGTTLAVQSSGSGTFQVAGTDEQRQYTTSTSIDYDQKAKNVCTYWQQTAPFGGGEYTC